MKKLRKSKSAFFPASSTADNAITSLELIIHQSSLSGAPFLLKTIVMEYRMTRSRLEAAERRISELETESEEEAA